MDNTTNTCTACYPACPDALGFPSSCEIEQLYMSRREHEKHLALFEAQEHIENALDRLRSYSE